jgi:hypothetical protein
LQLTDVQELLSRAVYRSGWVFTASDSREGVRVRIEATVDDRSGGGQRDLGIDTWPSPNDVADADAFYVWLAWRLQRIENHESREYLRIDGRIYDDPHA